jgi:molecular chaperone DnaK (HSP70)
MSAAAKYPGFPEFIEGLRKEKAAYTALLDLSSEQEEHMAKGELAEALELLRKKAAVMEDVSKLQGVLSQWKAEWTARRGSVTSDERAEVEKIIGDIQTTLKHVIEKEDCIQKAVDEKKKGTVQDITKTQATRAAGAAYLNPKKDGESRFFDQKK